MEAWMEFFAALLLLAAISGMGAGSEWYTSSETDPIDDTRSALALRAESPGSWTRTGRYRLLGLFCEEPQAGEEPDLGAGIFWNVRMDDLLNFDAEQQEATRRTTGILTRFGDEQARRWTYERVEMDSGMFVTFPHDMDRFLREAKKAKEVALRLEHDVTGTHTTVFDLTGSARIINAMANECETPRQTGTLRNRIARETPLLDEERRSLLEAGRIEYIAQIKDKIERNWLRPPGTASGLKCVVRVSQLPGGDVVQVDIQTGSGNIAFDRSVEEAILRSSPLPVPKDPSLFDRNILITFEPEA